MKNKKIVFTFIITSVILAGMFFAVLFIYDPLKIFHKPWKYKEYLQWDMRQQAAGIINNWDYDSIILGTSILECTSSKDASENLGGKFINISLSGSYFFERAIVLNYVLKKKPINKVIYSLDSIGLVATDKSDGTFKIDNWAYLYDNNPINDFHAYINDKYIKCIFSFSSKSKCMGTKADFDRPNTWHTLPDQSIRFGGIDNWFKSKDNNQIKHAFQMIFDTIGHIKQKKVLLDTNLAANIEKSKAYIYKNLIKYAEQYPDTEFILILPPYSRIKFAIEAQYKKSLFERYKASIKYIVSKSSSLPNISIYGWGNHAFVDNIANYKDPQHYEHTINRWMLDAIKREEGLLNPSNINKYLDTFTDKALHYDLFELGDKIHHYLNTENKKQRD